MNGSFLIMTRFFAFFLSLILLSGCVPMQDMLSVEKLTFWKQKKVIETGRPKPHESWCYKTLGAVDCYRTPQNVSPERLVGVSPLLKRPLTRDNHAQALLEAAQKNP